MVLEATRATTPQLWKWQSWHHQGGKRSGFPRRRTMERHQDQTSSKSMLVG